MAPPRRKLAALRWIVLSRAFYSACGAGKTYTVGAGECSVVSAIGGVGSRGVLCPMLMLHVERVLDPLDGCAPGAEVVRFIVGVNPEPDQQGQSLVFDRLEEQLDLALGVLLFDAGNGIA